MIFYTAEIESVDLLLIDWAMLQEEAFLIKEQLKKQPSAI